MSDWWDDLQPWQEDESGSGSDGGGGIGEFLVDDTIEANHNILSDLRDNDFDLNDPSYSECVQTRAPRGPSFLLLCTPSTTAR